MSSLSRPAASLWLGRAIGSGGNAAQAPLPSASVASASAASCSCQLQPKASRSMGAAAAAASSFVAGVAAARRARPPPRALCASEVAAIMPAAVRGGTARVGAEAAEGGAGGEGGEQRYHVRFFHEVEPDLWDRLGVALRDFAANCEGGRFASARELVEGVRGIRYLTNGGNPSLPALRRAIDEVDDRGICSTSELMGPVFARLARLAADLPSLFGDGLPILPQYREGQVCLRRKQCAALLAASFFGALPGQAAQAAVGRAEGRWFQLPSFDMGYLLEQEDEKLLCFLCYFAQVFLRDALDTDEVVSFSRRSLDALDPEYWESLDVPLCPASVCSDGVIEESKGNLQADFANKYLGGGALHRGSVQEEIRFSVCPECCVGMLFCEAMADGEAIFIVGTRQFSHYTGYGSTFEFDRPCTDEPVGPRDAMHRRGPHIVAIDALEFPHDRQYGQELILRELLKVRAACLGDLQEGAGQRQTAFATGNWGCGVFGGDPQLKALIQWLAASSAQRELIYFPFGDHRVRELPRVIEAVSRSGATCRDLFRLLQGHAPGQVFERVLELSASSFQAAPDNIHAES